MSGAGLFLFGIPLTLAIMQTALGSEQGFELWRERLTHPFVKLVMIGFIWAYLHHFFAGLRFLALDLQQGIEIKQAHFSAKLIIYGSLALTLMLGLWLW